MVFSDQKLLSGAVLAIIALFGSQWLVQVAGEGHSMGPVRLVHRSFAKDERFQAALRLLALVLLQGRRRLRQSSVRATLLRLLVIGGDLLLLGLLLLAGTLQMRII